jgi:pimeloyl-ACP methyl ester carboxylesterase
MEQELAYDVRGSGTAILLLHGVPLSRQLWRDQLEPFSRFGRVIAPDLPGFGDSPRGAESSIAAMATALYDLCNTMGIFQQVIILGLSLGSYVALEFYRQYPNRVKALGLVSMRPIPETDDTRRLRLATAAKILKRGLAEPAQAFIPRLLAPQTLQVKPHVVEVVRQLILNNEPNRMGLAQALHGLAERPDPAPLLKQLRVPTLVVTGYEDALVSVEEVEAMAASIPQAFFHALPDTGHLPNLEQPELFLRVCALFFREIGL